MMQSTSSAFLSTSIIDFLLYSQTGNGVLALLILVGLVGLYWINIGPGKD